LAAAESCTGGLICAALTAVAGSSDVVDRGFVTYSNAAKTDMLGVDPELIARCGAVSAEVAGQMSRGALERSAAQIAVSVTGIAGPGGGSPDKPVGLVFISVASVMAGMAGMSDGNGSGQGGDRRVDAVVEECRFNAGLRDGIREATVERGLQLLLERARRG